jgi:hypothetical protein
MDRTIERIRAVLRFISPDDITPMGVRMIQKVLDEEETMKNARIQVATSIGDLAGLPVGTRIATNHNKLLVLDKYIEQPYWFEEGELTPYRPLVHWLPAFILPAPERSTE